MDPVIHGTHHMLMRCMQAIHGRAIDSMQCMGRRFEAEHFAVAIVSLTTRQGK
jgi:hypothetical protein